MKSRTVAFVLLAQLAVLAVPASGAEALKGDAAAGATKAAVCGACHGATGNSINPEWPNLAAQHHEYVTEQLALLKAGVRVAPVMQPMAATLSPQDMADVAAYFEKQTPTGLEADAALWQAGEKLYRGGDAKRGIPACLACHGPDGRGNGPAAWPQIRSQQATYVSNQLHAYAAGTRYTTVAGQPAPPANAEMMYDIAKRLSDADIKALAAYVMGLR
jgi:cytochrome c553